MVEDYKSRYPEYGDGIDNGILRWNFCNVIDKCGTMYGALVKDDNSTMYVQEEGSVTKNMPPKVFNSGASKQTEHPNMNPMISCQSME